VDDVPAAAAEATGRGARRLADQDGYAVLRSPGGLVFCLVPGDGSRRRPAPVRAPGGSSSLVDQLSMDVPSSVFDAEAVWWSELLGLPVRAGGRPEFAVLPFGPGHPLRLLLHRLDGPDDRPGMHLDLACTDRAAELARHQALGAVHESRGEHWDVLRDPAGRRYCVTSRDPATGNLPAS
jgi:hypothetical protein